MQVGRRTPVTGRRTPVTDGVRERLFIGVAVPEATRETIARQLPRSIPGKQSPPENWHFTLRFLGATEPHRRDALVSLLRTTKFGQSFEIHFDTLGAFPNARRARVLWIGVGKGEEHLVALADKVENAAIEAGFDPESRRFSAHLTISRMKEPMPLSHLLATTSSVNARMRVSRLILYRSEPGGSHSRYSVVAEFPLGE